MAIRFNTERNTAKATKKVIENNKGSKTVKSAAGYSLVQRSSKTGKFLSSHNASTAMFKTLRNKSTSKTEKISAGSALSQASNSKK